MFWYNTAVENWLFEKLFETWGAELLGPCDRSLWRDRPEKAVLKDFVSPNHPFKQNLGILQHIKACLKSSA